VRHPLEASEEVAERPGTISEHTSTFQDHVFVRTHFQLFSF
jgi:hypothetical protein